MNTAKARELVDCAWNLSDEDKRAIICRRLDAGCLVPSDIKQQGRWLLINDGNPHRLPVEYRGDATAEFFRGILRAAVVLMPVRKSTRSVLRLVEHWG